VRALKSEILLKSAEYLVSSVEHRNPAWSHSVEDLDIQRDQLGLAEFQLTQIDLLEAERLKKQIADLRERIEFSQRAIVDRIIYLMGRSELRSA
jgi:hypothetical protein